MTRWSQTNEEYDHIRHIMIDQAVYGPAVIFMKDKTIVRGLVLGSNSGNNVGENMRAGLGPIVTSLHGEIRVELEDGRSIEISALDIEGIRPDTK